MSDPWFQFYASDWLAGTRGLTPAETGIYITLIAMMYETRAPISMEKRRIARLCNCPPGAFAKALECLIDDGKIIETEGGLWNERVENEIQKREVASQNGRDSAQKRWSIQGKKTQQNQQTENAEAYATAMPSQCDSDANQNQNQNNVDTSVSTAHSGAPPVDFTKEVFDRGVAFLSEFGEPEKNARSLIGKWRKQAGDTETLNALRDAGREGVTEPVAWINARLTRPAARQRSAEDDIAEAKRLRAERQSQQQEASR